MTNPQRQYVLCLGEFLAQSGVFTRGMWNRLTAWNDGIRINATRVYGTVGNGTAALSLTRRLVVYLSYVAYSAVHRHRWARQRISSSHPRLSPHCIALTDLFRDYDLKETAHIVT